MAKIDLYDSLWCEHVFEGRNKEYGAYQLRKDYTKNMIRGIVFAIVFFTLVMTGPLIANLITGFIPEENVLRVTEVTDLIAPPPIDEKTPPPPPVEPPPPVRQTVKFTPPVILPDEKVPDEPPPTVEELKVVDAGVKTQEGTKDAPLIIEDPGEAVIEGSGDAPFISVEQMPAFPGGEGEMQKYIYRNYRYPPMARENNIQGTVFMQFVVERDGSVSEVKVLRGLSRDVDEEAIRVIKSLPKFTPGRQNGRPVRVFYNLPIRLTLQN